MSTDYSDLVKQIYIFTRDYFRKHPNDGVDKAASAIVAWVGARPRKERGDYNDLLIEKGAVVMAVVIKREKKESEPGNAEQFLDDLQPHAGEDPKITPIDYTQPESKLDPEAFEEVTQSIFDNYRINGKLVGKCILGDVLRVVEKLSKERIRKQRSEEFWLKVAEKLRKVGPRKMIENVFTPEEFIKLGFNAIQGVLD